MSSSSPLRARTFRVYGKRSDLDVFDALEIAPRAQRTGALELYQVVLDGENVRIDGKYTVHGNGEADLRRIGEQKLTDVRVETLSLETLSCGDRYCGGCAKHDSPRMVDAWGLAGGGIILGGVQAGFELLHRVSHGFGDESVDANRHLLGTYFEIETADEWTPMKGVAYVAGVPPCSGFSNMNTSAAIAKKRGKVAKNFRGMDSPINECQRELIMYAARCFGMDGGRGPEVVSFESVQGAYTKGRELMTEYLNLLNGMTGQRYRLYHLMHSAASLGIAQQRSRYFWVASRVPFGVEIPELNQVMTYRDAISDLENVELQEDASVTFDLPLSQTAYQRDLRRYDSRTHGQVSGASERTDNAMSLVAPFWGVGEDFPTVYRRYIENASDGKLPPGISWDYENSAPKGFMGPRRPPYDYPGYVLTGAAGSDFIHPTQDRLLTLRELARLMSIPDDWRVDYAAPNKVSMQLGKNCPTTAGRWLGNWVMAAINGNPGSVVQYGPRKDEGDGDAEFVVDITNRWRAIWKEQKAALLEEAK